MDFPTFIKKARKKRGLSLTKAAPLIGISISYLCDIEKGRAGNPKMDFIYKLAEIYGVNVDDLCIYGKRIPRDIFDKIVENPALYSVIRNFEA